MIFCLQVSVCHINSISITLGPFLLVVDFLFLALFFVLVLVDFSLFPVFFV